MDLVGKYILAENATSVVEGGGAGSVNGAGSDRGERERTGAALLETYFPALMDRLVSAKFLR